MRKNEYELLLWPSDEPDQVVRIEHASVSYRINDIPQAMVRLAHGHSLRDGAVAKIPDSWRDPRKLFRIGYKERSRRSYDKKVVTTERIIFEGYPRTPSAEISTGGGDLTLLLQHWLSDLATSVVRSQYSYPGHVEQKNMDAAVFDQGKAGLGGAPQGIAVQIGLPGGWEFLILDDIWAKGAKQIIATLLTKRDARTLSLSPLCIDAINSPTAAAAEALRRIQGPSETLGTDYTDGQPLGLYRGEDEQALPVIARGVAQVIGYRPLAEMQASTAWDLITEFNSAFATYLIPRPTDAFIAPVIPGLNRYYDKQILEDEIIELSWSDTRNVNLRGVAIAAQIRDRAGVNASGQAQSAPGGSSQAKDTITAGGCYITSGDSDDGLVAFMRPPIWIASSGVDTATAAQVYVSGDASGTNSPPEPPNANDKPVSMSDYYTAYAKQRYIEEQLRGRQLQVLTNFRTDICVGSSVAVAIRNEHLRSRLGLTTTSLVGIVREVTLTISRVSKGTHTSFTLDFVRMIDELEDDKLSVNKHPVFDSVFTGAVLA